MPGFVSEEVLVEEASAVVAVVAGEHEKCALMASAILKLVLSGKVLAKVRAELWDGVEG